LSISSRTTSGATRLLRWWILTRTTNWHITEEREKGDDFTIHEIGLIANNVKSFALPVSVPFVVTLSHVTLLSSTYPSSPKRKTRNLPKFPYLAKKYC
jgi:hypothetical protein